MELDRRAEPLLSRHAAWLLVTLAYLYVFPYFERINNPNENVRVWATRAIVEHHVLNIDQLSREWGYVNDKATTGAHLYSSKAPGTTFLGVPVLFAETYLHRLTGLAPPTKRQTTLWLRVFSVELPMSLFFFFFARYVERVTRSPVARDLLVVGLGLGTLLYSYGVMFVGHAQAAALAFGGYMLLSGVFAAPNDEWSSSSSDALATDHAASNEQLGWAGFLIAMSVVFEYQALLVCATLTVYAVARYRRRAVFFLAGTGAGRVSARGLSHRALRPAMAFPLRLPREPRVPAPASLGRFSRAGAAQAVGDRLVAVRARLRPLRLLADPGARRRVRVDRGRPRRAARGDPDPVDRGRDAPVPGRHDQLARRLVRRPALHRDRRAVPDRRHRARLARGARALRCSRWSPAACSSSRWC